MGELHDIAKKLVSKGILAIDESTGTCKKRFDSIGVESTEENRRAYRSMLVTAPDLEKYVSGVILFDETVRQKTDDGTPIPKALLARGILPGIKVDTGAKGMPLHPNEKLTQGLDNLRNRLAEYKTLGAKFAKWRAVITIVDNHKPKLPSKICIQANADRLAAYAAFCQEQGIVPIVEPEVLMNGKHSLNRCYEVTRETLQIVFQKLKSYNVDLKGMVLKPNMILPGLAGPDEDIGTVAKQTINCLRANVPAEVPGIAFLSGGQSDELATAHLNTMNTYQDLPWRVTFSYGRALQAAALQAWQGKAENKQLMQTALLQRAKDCFAASKGRYE